jgi:hypothetical protein
MGLNKKKTPKQQMPQEENSKRKDKELCKCILMWMKMQ